MATAKKTKTSNIITLYMETALENEKFPLSVYKFCKTNGIEESDFYKTYASLDSVKLHIWQVFFENTMDLIRKNKRFDDFSRKDRLLTFYFTFFEVLQLNRSYVFFALSPVGSPMSVMRQLKKLKRSFKDFSSDLIEEGNDDKTLNTTKHPVALFSEAAWAQLLFLLKFWLDDTSQGSERTDEAIEKSVTVAFDVFDNTQLERILDLGKFLWKEKLNKAY
jgi:hypothetical protein